MQSLETRGKLKVEAAFHPVEGRFWKAELANEWQKSAFSSHRDDAGPRVLSTVSHTLPLSVSDKLLSISNGRSSGIQVLVCALIGELLRRYMYGANETFLGVPASDESESPGESAIPLRVTLTEQGSLRYHSNVTRSRLQDSLSNREYPIELLLESAIDASVTDLFGVFVSVSERLHSSGKIPEVGIAFLYNLDASSGNLNVRFDNSIYSVETIVKLLSHLDRLSVSALDNPSRSMEEIDIRLDIDVAVCLKRNETKVTYSKDMRLDDIFARQALLTPDAVAVRSGDTIMTYSDLNKKVLGLASTLRRLGAGPGKFVAVMLPRSPEMIVSIFAILRAGAGYVPIDTSYPADRVSYILEDSGAALVLVSGEKHHLVDPLRVVNVLDPDLYVPGYLGGEKSATDVAYVIYTSGSTGRPKGVLVEHHSVINRLEWMQRAYPLTHQDIILQKTPISFDVSVWELFWWTFCGASVCLLAPGAEKEPDDVLHAIDAYKVTTLHFVPSMLAPFLQYIADTNQQNRAVSIARFFASGEALSPHHVSNFFSVFGSDTKKSLVNLYGPTEATVDVSFHNCRMSDSVEGVPIGAPIDNIRLNVVDRNMMPQPIGIPGELCISGVGLARGYHNKDELTVEKFVAVPSLNEVRVYRTGDLAYWLPNGEIAYLGRIDSQVKIRGYRIELGEIEATLRKHGDVVEAVVVARIGNDKQNSLCAYVKGSARDTELRQYLAKSLPEYMVPRDFVSIKEFPLSPSGKLNFNALPSPKLAARTVHREPSNARESSLAVIWGAVLGVEKIGVDDNFFSIGGNSIHFVTVLAKCRALGVTFTFQELFTYPTISSLVNHLTNSGESNGERHEFRPFELVAESDMNALPPDAEDAYPMLMLQSGLIFQNELTFGTAQYHDIISYVIQGRLDKVAFERAVAILVNRNPIFRTSYHITGFSKQMQVVHKRAPSPLVFADLRGLSTEEQEEWHDKWLASERAHRFEWSRPGLIRLHVHILRDDVYRYVLSQHNSALDGWSITLVHTQLFDIYNKLVTGQTYTESNIHNHLRNYAGLEQDSLASVAAKTFWSNYLHDYPTTELPRLMAKNPNATFAVKFHHVDIPEAVSEGLVALADRLSLPLKSILMSVHVKVLAVLSNSDDVTTGYEHSGRPELEGATSAIGLFLNTVPFRVKVGSKSWLDLINDVYNAEANFLPFRRYPMAQIKSDLQQRGNLFETVFNFTHFYLLKALKELPEFSLLDIRANSETEFVLRAEFSRHFFTDSVRLSLDYHEHVLTAAQVERIGRYYVRAFESLITDVHADHSAQSLCDADEQAATFKWVNLSSESRRFIESSEAARYALVDKHLQPVPTGTFGSVVRVTTDDEKAKGGRWIVDLTYPPTGIRARRMSDGSVSCETPIASEESDGAVFLARSIMQDVHDTSKYADLSSRIARVWSEMLGVPVNQISADSNFFDLGGTSLDALRVIASLDGLVDLVELMHNSTLHPLVMAIIKRQVGSIKGVQLVKLTPQVVDPTTVVVFFPYAGGGAVNFEPLSRELTGADGRLMIYAVDLSTIDSQCEDSVDVLAAQISSQLERSLSVPVVIWGHCVGAALALECAWHLKQNGFEVSNLFIGGKLLTNELEARKNLGIVQSMTNSDVINWLIKETGYTELADLSEVETQKIASAFTRDASRSHRYFANIDITWSNRSLDLPISVVMSTDDPLTDSYQSVYEKWGRFGLGVGLFEIRGGGHYFCRTRAKEVKDIILRKNGVVT